MARKATYDSTIVKDVRHQALGDILEVLKETAKAKKFSQRKYDMLLKLATTVLPRVTEHTGNDGAPIVFMPVQLMEKYDLKSK
jgi:hypothetical protein